MFENFDFTQMGKMMKDMQDKAKDIEEKAREKRIIAKAGGGMIEVTADGMGEIIDITIDDSLLSDKSSLQILLISAINEINKQVDENKKSQDEFYC